MERMGRSMRLLAILLVFFVTAGSLEAERAHAVTIPKTRVEAETLKVQNGGGAVITGTVSKACGQRITASSEDGQTLFSQVTAGSSGAQETFRLEIPADALVRNGETVCLVRSCAVAGVAASGKVRVAVRSKELRKTPKIKVRDKIVLTNLKEKDRIRAKSASGQKMTYRSSNPSVVSVDSKGKIKRKRSGKVRITIRQKGNKKYTPAKRTVTIISRKSTRGEQIDAAVAWAVKIARDNSFAYGSGSGAHHNGCYFCGTNYGPRKYMKPSSRYKKTYCCNPFIHAAYAHGAQHPRMLAGCRRASGIGMEKSSFYKFGCWRCVGKPSYSKLQKGDVLVCHSHVAMYIGKKKLVEASGGGWSASSITVRHMSSSRYRGFTYVMRYTGY